MKKLFSFILALAAYASAQTSTTTTTSSTSSSSSSSSSSTGSSTVVQVFYLGPSPTATPTTTFASFDASVVSANSATTVLALECKGNCPVSSTYTITAGPSTYADNQLFTGSANGLTVTTSQVHACNITSSTQGASCSVSIGYFASVSGQDSSSVATTSTFYNSSDFFYAPVTVTAGLEKLNSPRATQTTGAGGRAGVGGAAVVAAAAALLI